MVRIGAQLVDGSDGVERWSENYDRAPGDEIKIQTDIAASVAQALSVALGKVTKAVLTLGGTSDSAAQDLLLQSKDLLVKKGDAVSVGRALDLLNAAIARDPNYADAYRAKASCLHSLGTFFPASPADTAQKLTEAEVAARRAIAIAPTLGNTYAQLASVKNAQFDFPSAVQNMRKAVELAPNDPGVLGAAVFFMELYGDLHKALQGADHLIALDPLRGLNYGQRADALFYLRDYAASITAARKNLAIDADSYGLHRRIGDCLVLMNRPAEAQVEYGKEPPDDPLRLNGEAIIAARTHNRGEVDRIVARMRRLFGDAASFQYAGIYAQAGDGDRAFRELENAVAAKDPGLQSLRIEPWFDPIRSDPRYAALVGQLQFPKWS
jgi:serine/threonine-protein kinase